MSDDELDEDVKIDEEPGGPEEATPEPRAGRRSLAPQAAAWHSWLLTLTGRTGRGRSSPPEAVVPRPVPSPTVGEEVSALGTAFDAVTAIEWQKLWLATQRRPWRSLAVVPVGSGIPTARVARALAEVGSGHLGPGMMVADAQNLALEWLKATMDSWTKRGDRIDRVLIALGPVLERPASLALAQAADASILCLVLNESSISEAARTVEEIGRERFLGSVILRLRKKKEVR